MMRVIKKSCPYMLTLRKQNWLSITVERSNPPFLLFYIAISFSGRIGISFIMNVTNDSLQTFQRPTVELGMFAVTKETYDQFIGFNTFVIPFLCVLGILGNSAGLFIFCRDPNRRKLIIYHYLISLFAVDTVYLGINGSFLLIELVERLNPDLGNFLSVVTWPYRGYIDMGLNHISSALLIIMSLERMMLLMFPFRNKRSVLTQFPKTILFLISVVSFSYLVPFIFCLGTKQIQTSSNATTYITYVKSEYLKLLGLFSLIETIILHYVCPVIVLVTNVLFLVALSRRLNKRDQSARPSTVNDSQNKITVLIVTVALLYVILSIPNIFIQTLIQVDDDYGINGPFKLTFKFFIDIGDLLASINAASDVFVYILVSRHYRPLFGSWFCKCCHTGDGETQPYRTTKTDNTSVGKTA